jgi:hypothetical protein
MIVEQQSSLFDSVATDTQIEALAELAPIQGRNRRLVYAAFCHLGGATDEVVADLLTMDIRAVAARRNELVDTGYIVDTGYRKKGRTGNKLIVWGEGCDPKYKRKAWHKWLLHEARRVLASDQAEIIEAALVDGLRDAGVSI